MLPELFRIPIPGFGEMPVYGYGLMMVVGFLVASQVAKYMADRTGLDGDFFINAALLALLSGVIGARLSHVLENIGQYTDPSRSFLANLAAAANIRSGGLTYYGGFLLATPTLIAYGLWKRIPILTGMDIIAPTLMIGYGFGRIGCLLNGCCVGGVCDASQVPWAIEYPHGSYVYQEDYDAGKITPPAELLYTTPAGAARLIPPREVDRDTGLRSLAAAQRSLPRHPAQVYSTFTAFLIAGITFCYYTLPHAPGRGFALMLMIEGLTRYLLELLRAEPPVSPAVFGSMSLSMVVGLTLVVAGAVFWFVCGHRPLDPSPVPQIV